MDYLDQGMHLSQILMFLTLLYPLPIMYLILFSFQFHLVCSDSWQVTLAQSLYMLGIFIGAGTSGIISDYFGRKKTIIFFSTSLSIFSIAIAFSNRLVKFLV